jgi:hypothetical protein
MDSESSTTLKLTWAEPYCMGEGRGVRFGVARLQGIEG